MASGYYISVDSTTNPTMLQVAIKGSKTAQLRQGVNIIGRTSLHICPVKSVLEYIIIACRGLKPGPLFCYRDGSPLTREQLVSLLRATLAAAGVDYWNFSGHSFRIGAASTAAARGDSGLYDTNTWSMEKWIVQVIHSNANLELTDISGKLIAWRYYKVHIVSQFINVLICCIRWGSCPLTLSVLLRYSQHCIIPYPPKNKPPLFQQ